MSFLNAFARLPYPDTVFARKLRCFHPFLLPTSLAASELMQSEPVAQKAKTEKTIKIQDCELYIRSPVLYYSALIASGFTVIAAISGEYAVLPLNLLWPSFESVIVFSPL